MKLQDWHRRYLYQAEWTRQNREFIFRNLELGTSPKIFEAGCGTGAILESLSFPTQSIVGMDIDLKALHFGKNQKTVGNVIQGDGHRIPVKTASFDVTFCHFFLLWTANPLQVLREMMRITKPGGYVAALAEPDYGARIDFPDDLASFGRLQEQSLQAQGANTQIGRELGRLFHQSGLVNVNIGILGAIWQMDWLADIDNEDLIMENDLQKYHHDQSESLIDRYCQKDKQARENKERILFIPTFFGVGRKKR
ncbi:MAG: methyltransferase domain-containing protein [Anaerolineales bacterium]|nr:methyltransferase domain-containing protein [Anaerolineales bacterium]